MCNFFFYLISNFYITFSHLTTLNFKQIEKINIYTIQRQIQARIKHRIKFNIKKKIKTKKKNLKEGKFKRSEYEFNYNKRK